MTPANPADSADLVMADLVDLLIQENLGGFADRLRPQAPDRLPGGPLRGAEQWCRLDLPGGWICFRARPTGPLQPWRLSRAPVWHASGSASSLRALRPDELIDLVAAEPPGTAAALTYTRQVSDELRTAVAHTETLRAGRARLGRIRPRPGELACWERLAATRNRPFHPTARAAVGWSADDLARYGPMPRQALGLDWVAVRRDRLRSGSGADSDRLHEILLDERDRDQLAAAVRGVGLSWDEFQPLPVHPWQFEQVLPSVFQPELAGAEVVPLVRGLGGFHPTASLRTLSTAPETGFHVKLPLGVATLGAARLLPPRYLDNGERAERTMRELIDRCEVLRSRVRLCDERSWCGWDSSSEPEESEGRSGQLGAQLRRYPSGVGCSHRGDDPARLVVPMATLAAHEWDVLAPALEAAGFGPRETVVFFRRLAEAFCELGFGFLRFGVMPELHGQNVLVSLRGGAVDSFVLRDHDTLRLYPDWMAAEDVPDPGYRIRPGAPQSLRLASAEALLGYLQTLGFQLNLYGIADALCRHHGIDERTLWAQLRGAVTDTLSRITLPSRVSDLVERQLLAARTWPSRLVLGPLLRQGRSAGVSMPAGVGQVPNPLLSAGPDPTRAIAERAARQRLLNCFLREAGERATFEGTLLRVPLPESGAVLLVRVDHWSVLGHHSYADELRVQSDGEQADPSESAPIGHRDLVRLLLTELSPRIEDGRDPTELAAQIDNSVEHTARYLDHGATFPPRDADPRTLTRCAEQSLRFGHPFHPTPKSAEGFSRQDLAAYAPELGASFALHYFAVVPELVVEDRLRPDAWIPPEVVRQARQALPDLEGGRVLVPVHPWQARHLTQQQAVAELLADGALVALGPLGHVVYPTSSVRTVCDPAFPTAWKLPLHVRITNFIRNNPVEHARRAVDASRVLDRLRGRWSHDGFEVLIETGYRTVAIRDLTAEVTVLFRENPFVTGQQAPQVVAGLLESPADHLAGEPELIGYLRRSSGRPRRRPSAEHTVRWLRRYLEISLLPMLAVFAADGVSLEAHVQNSLVHLCDGWPTRFFVRDMEGTSVSRQRWATDAPVRDLLSDDSPVLYDDAEAWSRLRYYVVTNQLGHLVHVLGRHTEVTEPRLWRVIAEAVRAAEPSRYTRDLLCSPVLPAKANLISRFTDRGERPVYVDIANPISQVI